MINKQDLKDWYQRVNMWAYTAAVCLAVVRNFLLLLPYLPFGSSSASGDFYLLSEMIVDLYNDLMESQNGIYEKFPSQTEI